MIAAALTAPRSLRRAGWFSGIPQLATAAGLAGLMALAFHAWAGAELSHERFAKLVVAWTVMTLVSQIIGASLEQWCSREAATGRRTSSWLVVGALLAMAVLSGGAAWWLTGDAYWAAVAAIGAGGIGAAQWRKGVLQGAGAIPRAARLLLADPAVRLLAVPLMGFGWSIPTGATVAACALGRGARLDLERPRRRCGAGWFVLESSAASTACQLLMGGAPLAAWAAGASNEQVVSVFLLFLLSRAPVTLVLASQGALLAGLARRDRSAQLILGALIRWRALVALGIIAGIGGGAVLPRLIAAMAGVGIPAVPSGMVAAGMALCAAVQLVGQKPSADGRPLVVGGPWMWGLAAAVLVGGRRCWRGRTLLGRGRRGSSSAPPRPRAALSTRGWVRTNLGTRSRRELAQAHDRRDTRGPHPGSGDASI